MAWATPRPLTSPGHMASAGAIPSPPFFLQAGLGPWGSSSRETPVPAWPAPPSTAVLQISEGVESGRVMPGQGAPKLLRAR